MDISAGFVIGVIAAYFIGRTHGTMSEMGKWIIASIEERPIISDGKIFSVKCIGGDE